MEETKNEPFGKEWKAAMMQHSKKDLIEMLEKEYKEKIDGEVDNQKPTKTIEDWLNEIEDETIREQVLANYDPNFCKDSDVREMVNCIPDALTWGFNWYNTKEGANYWYALYLQLK